MLHEAGDEYMGDCRKKPPATLQQSEARASQLAGIGELLPLEMG